jgi:hypothetical protein
MRSLEVGEEVMLHGEAANAAKNFNPYYGLVVKDLGWDVTEDLKNDWKIVVLWEDGQERTHQRHDLLDWKSLPVSP